MASIKSRGRNRWFVRVFLGREQGRVKFHDKLIHGSKHDADAYARKMETARDNGTLAELLNPQRPEVLTLDAYLDRWLKEAVKPTVREGTFEDYADILKRYVRPALGAYSLDGLEAPDIQAIYNAMRARGLSTRSIQYCHTVLTAALKQAVGWKLLTINPAQFTKRPQGEADELQHGAQEKIQVLTAQEADAFLKSAKGDPMGTALTFALATGCRPEEYLALRWSDVDFDRSEVRIRQVVQWRRKRNGGGFYFLPPKTKGSRRTLRVGAELLKLLTAHRRKQMAHRLKLGSKYKLLDLVFPASEGTPMQRRNLFARHMQPVMTAAKLDKKLTLYSLRHSFCTLTLGAGLDPKQVSMMMGHKSVAFTMDKYQHVLPAMREATADQLEKLLFKKRRVG
jgi:integrase